jgi:hypothetical protein
MADLLLPGENIDFARNSYFVMLQDPEITLRDILHSQLPFIHAVAMWSNILIKLALRFPEAAPVFLNNVQDEIGHGNPSKFHIVTFHNFLVQLGWDGSTRYPEHTSVTYFNDSLLYHAGHSSFNFVAGLLAGIENSYVTVSQLMNTIIGSRLLIKLEHYETHAILDVDHAQDLRKLCTNPQDLDFIRGEKTGEYLLYQLYTGITGLLTPRVSAK